MKRLIFLLFLASITATVLFAQPAGRAISINGLKAVVTVRRDARSIPYIEASNDADLYFAQGYTTASDRLWQMDLMRRLARGQTAEIFGKATLEEDKRWRRFGFSKIADESLQHLQADLRLALDAYSKGVNSYIATLDDKSIPVEFRILQYRPRHWTPSDTIVIGKILADALSSTWRQDLLKASLQNFPKDKFADLANQITPYDVVLFGKDVNVKKISTNAGQFFEVPTESLVSRADEDELQRKNSLSRIGFFAEELAASNNWVISGKRTVDGKPILANDPHLQPTAPGIWYLTHLSNASVRVSGVTFPGVPGIVLGHNENIAWGATNVGPDVQDLYLEAFDAEGKYKTPSGWATPIIRKEEIRVRANPLKPETEVVLLDVIETRNGSIILEDGGKKYALKWTARDPKNNDFAAFYQLNRAKNWDEFKGSLRNYRGATQNFVYADVKGNIGWYAAGAIPIRKTGDGSLPFDGTTDDGEWTGYIPFEELPHLYNPAEGLIVTANQRIVGTDYKYGQMSRDAAPPWRASRLYNLLSAEKKATMDTIGAAQYDAFNIPLSNLAGEIVRQNGASEETRIMLRNWDGRMSPDSKAALVLNEIRLCLANKIAEDNKPVPANLIRERILDWAVRENSARWLPKQFADYPALLKTCDSEAVAGLAARYGSDRDKWIWGNISKSRFDHPLAAVPLIGGQFAIPQVGLNGSGQTPNVASFVSMRLIASPGNWDETHHVIPLGQSGDPKSAHFKDQFESWKSGAASVFPFSKEAVERSTLHLHILEPVKK